MTVPIMHLTILVFGALLAEPPAPKAPPSRAFELRQMPPAEPSAADVRNILTEDAGVATALVGALKGLCSSETTLPVRFVVGIAASEGSSEPQQTLLALAWPQDIGGRRVILMGPIITRDQSCAPDQTVREARWCHALTEASPQPPIPTIAVADSVLNPTLEEVVCCQLLARELQQRCLGINGMPKEGLDESARAELLTQARKCHAACVMPTADPLVLCARFENLDAVRAAMLVLDEHHDAELLRLDMLHMATSCGANALVERLMALGDEKQPAKQPVTSEEGWSTLAWAFVDACDRFRQVQASNAKLMERAASECSQELGYEGADAANIRRGFAAIVPYMPLGRALPGSTPQRAVEIARDRCYSDIPTAELADRLAYTVPWVIYGHAWSQKDAMLPSEAARRKRYHALIMDDVRNGIDALLTKVPADFRAQARVEATESARRLSEQLADPWLPESVFCPDNKRMSLVRTTIRETLNGKDRDQDWEMDARGETTYRIEAVRWHIDSELGGEWSLQRPTRLMPFRGVSANYRNGMSLSSGQLYLDLSDTGEGP